MSGIGREFIEKTKYQYEEDSSQERGEKQPSLQVSYEHLSEIIDLPDIESIYINDINLRDAIEKRRSLRLYSGDSLTIEELTYLLWCTQGVKESTSQRTVRNVPSAGARHCLETYLLINNVESIRKGLYRYLALENKLAIISLEDNIEDKITNACLGQKMVKTGAVTFIWVTVSERMTWRYGERGYRYMYLDAGHVCQNLYLAAENINSGACAIAAYEDDELNKILSIDGEEQFVIYLASLGKKK